MKANSNEIKNAYIRKFKFIISLTYELDEGLFICLESAKEINKEKGKLRLHSDPFGINLCFKCKFARGESDSCLWPGAT